MTSGAKRFIARSHKTYNDSFEGIISWKNNMDPDLTIVLLPFH